MKLTKRQQKTVELSSRLLEKIGAMEASGLDPLEHPEVQRIMDEIIELPEEGKRLEVKQEMIRVQMADLVASWLGGESLTVVLDAEKQVDEMINQIQEGETVKKVTQDETLQRMLSDYLAIDEQIIDMLSKE